MYLSIQINKKTKWKGQKWINLNAFDIESIEFQIVFTRMCTICDLLKNTVVLWGLVRTHIVVKTIIKVGFMFSEIKKLSSWMQEGKNGSFFVKIHCLFFNFCHTQICFNLYFCVVLITRKLIQFSDLTLSLVLLHFQMYSLVLRVKLRWLS